MAFPVPWWVEVLRLSEKWGTPPWDLVWDKGKTLWVLRERMYSSTVELAKRDKEKHKK